MSVSPRSSESRASSEATSTVGSIVALAVLGGYLLLASMYALGHLGGQEASISGIGFVLIAVGVVAAFVFVPLDRRALVPVIVVSAAGALMWGLIGQTTPSSDFALLYGHSQQLGDGVLEALWASKSAPTVALYGAPFALFGASLFLTWVIGAILHALHTYLVYLVACEVDFLRSSAVRAAALFGLLPALIGYAPVLNTEGPFLALVLTGTWLLLRWRKREQTWLLVVAGMALGVAFLTRGVGVAFIVGALAFLVATTGWSRWRFLAERILLFGVGLLVAFGSQLTLNVAYGGEWTLMTSPSAPVIFMFGTNRETRGGYSMDDLTIVQWKRDMTPEELEIASGRAVDIAIDRILDDVPGFVWFALTDKMARLWQEEAQFVRAYSIADGRRDDLDVSMLRMAIDAWHLAFVALSLVGVGVLIARLSTGRLGPHPGVFPLIVGPLLVLAVLHLFVEVQPRYHLAFVPNLALFAGYGAGFLRQPAMRTAAAGRRVRGETPP